MAARLTIVMSVFNREDILDRTLQSLLQQDTDASSFRVIIADGGSSDDSPNIANRFATQHPEIFQFLPAISRLSLNVTRNLGWRTADTPSFCSWIPIWWANHTWYPLT